MRKKKVVVGMSGGVDSSVAAYILKEQGYEVIGVTMQIWQDEEGKAYYEEAEDGGCCGLSAVDDARRVSHLLDIPYYVLNFKQDFKEKVIDYFVDEYTKGRTPNPCIACNRYVKWEAMLRKSMQLGADYIATGHYARIATCPDTGRLTLGRSAAAEKDQTYALYSLTQQQLAHTLMPVGDYTKDEIREMAKKIGLSVADKPDSQEICFIPDHDYAKFIKESTGADFDKGNFVDVNGRILGEHQGIIHYTVGQRKGFGVSFGKRMYVKEIDVSANQVILADDAQVYEKSLLASCVNFMAIHKISSAKEPMKAKAKIRYGQKAADCVLSMENERLKVMFDKPQRAITPGQAVVAYDESGEYVLCGGVIDNLFNS